MFGTCLVYSYGLLVGNYQYLIQDLFFATAAAACMAMTRPAARLSRQRPPAGLVSAHVMLPVAANFLAIVAFQASPARAGPPARRQQVTRPLLPAHTTATAC